MKLINYKQVKREKVEDPNSKNAFIRWVISDKDNAPNFAMRVFEIEPKGFTPYHKHNWEHEVFILEGKGVLVHEGKEYPFSSGDVIFIPGGENHQFKNNSSETLSFICLIPIQNKCIL